MWTPNAVGEPHSYAQLLTGAIPFGIEAQGSLEREAARVGEVTLIFESVLTATSEACLIESISAIWVSGRRLYAWQVTPPDDWLALDLFALTGWPGTSVLLVSPWAFRGLEVDVDFGPGHVRRAVALTEWRGEPSNPTLP